LHRSFPVAATKAFEPPRCALNWPAAAAGKLAARALSAEQTFKALNFSASPAFHNYGNAQTLHTIVAEPAKRRFLIGIGGDAAALDEDMMDVDFKVWITGENLPTKHLKGQLGLGLQRSPRTTGKL
jgi:hypothetical protein